MKIKNSFKYINIFLKIVIFIVIINLFLLLCIEKFSDKCSKNLNWNSESSIKCLDNFISKKLNNSNNYNDEESYFTFELTNCKKNICN